MRASARSLWARLGVAGKVAVAAVGLGLLVLLASAPGLLSALLTPQPDPPRAIDRAGRAQAGRFETHVAQINGRSLFFIPAPPPPPSEGPAIVRDDGPREPLRPARYGGPGLIALVNDQAWFADGLVLAVGGEAADGLRVISADPPWSATVLWSGVEFKVPLLERDSVVMKPESQAPPPAPERSSLPPAPPPDPIAEESGSAEDQPNESKEKS